MNSIEKLQFVRQFAIDDFKSCLKKNEFSYFFQWDKFTSMEGSNVQFSLEINPTKPYSDYVSLGLTFFECKGDKSENVIFSMQLRIDFSILNYQGLKSNTNVIRKTIMKSRYEPNLLVYTLNQYIHKDYLLDPTNGFFNNGKLTLSCELEIKNIILVPTSIKLSKPTLELELNVDLHKEIVQKIMKTPISSLSVKSDSKSSKNTKSCSNSSDSSPNLNLKLGSNEKISVAKNEFTFLVQGQAFSLKKAFLSSKSKILNACIEKKDISSIKISDTEPAVFAAAIDFICNANADPIREMSDKLFVIGARFGFEELKLSCEEWICSNMNTETVLNALLLGEENKSEKIKNGAIDFIIRNSCVRATDQYNLIIKENPKLLNDMESKF